MTALGCIAFGLTILAATAHELAPTVSAVLVALGV